MNFFGPGTMSSCAMCTMGQPGKSSWDRYDIRMIELAYSGVSTRFLLTRKGARV